MIHQYKLGGYNIVLDVCSGALHVVDDLSYDIIASLEAAGAFGEEESCSAVFDLWGLPAFSP